MRSVVTCLLQVWHTKPFHSLPEHQEQSHCSYRCVQAACFLILILLQVTPDAGANNDHDHNLYSGGWASRINIWSLKRCTWESTFVFEVHVVCKCVTTLTVVLPVLYWCVFVTSCLFAKYCKGTALWGCVAPLASEERDWCRIVCQLFTAGVMSPCRSSFICYAKAAKNPTMSQ